MKKTNIIRKSIPIFKNVWFQIAILVCIGIIIRFLKLYYNDPITRDSVMYCKWAETWARTGEMFHVADFGAKFIPLYIWFMKCGIKCGLTAVQAGLIINLTSGILLIIVGFLMARYFFDDSVLAFLCGALFAVHPKAVEYSCLVLREEPFLLFTALMGLCIINAWKSKRYMWWFLAGILSAFAISIRIEGVEYIIMMAFLMLVSGFIPSIRKHVLIGGTVFITSALCLLVCISVLLQANVQYYREMFKFRCDTVSRNYQAE